MKNTPIAERVIVRLHPDIYRKLEAKLSRTIVTEATTPLTAGYALGVEAVLKEIRNGLTLEVESVQAG